MATTTRVLLAALVATLLVGTGSAQSLLAPTPPMGWNSWDSFGTTVTEAEVKANADYMAKHLRAHGWQYVVVDIQWSELNPRSHGYRPNAELAMDGFGRLIPAPNRFPSSADGKGFKPLADYVHSLGLKFGIHVMRGIPRRAADANLPIARSTPHGCGGRGHDLHLPVEHGHVRHRRHEARRPVSTTSRLASSTLRGAWTSSRPTTCSGMSPTAITARRSTRSARRSARAAGRSCSASLPAFARTARASSSPCARTCGASPTTSGTAGSTSRTSSRA